MLTVHGVQVRVPFRPLSLTEQDARDGGSEGSRIGSRPLRQGRVPHGCRGVLDGRDYRRHRYGQHGANEAQTAACCRLRGETRGVEGRAPAAGWTMEEQKGKSLHLPV